MSEAASSAAPAASPATTEAAPAATAAKPVDKPASPADSMDRHIAFALAEGEKADAAEKHKPATKKKSAAAKAAPAPAKKAAPVPAAPPPAPAATPEPAADDDEPVAKGNKLTPRQLLEAGELDAAFEAAFGKKPGDFNVNSKKWAEWRQATSRIKAAHERKVQEDRRAIAAEHQQVQQLWAQAREEAQQFIPFIKAKKLYDDGDIEGAIKTAFGSDATDFNKRLIRAAHGKNPEVEQLKAQIAADKAERERERQQYAQQLAERREQEQVQANLSWVADNLPAIETEHDYSGAAKRPAFVRRVYEILCDHYDSETNATLPLSEAADMARQEFEEHFGAAFAPRGAAVTATSDRGGSNPASREPAKALKTLSQTGAAEASAPPRGAHGLSLEEHVRMFSEPRANGARAH